MYDGVNRPAQVTYADSSTTSYTFDGGNRVTQIVDSVSGTITRGYDNLDRLTSETTPQGSVSYTYDAAGRRATMTVAGQPTVTYAYDNANKLTDIAQGSSNIHFDYDTAGRRTKTTLPNGVTENYTYDAASRLTGIEYWNGTTLLGNLTYEYDAAGNRTKIGGSYARTGLPQPVSSSSYNEANQQTAWAGTMQTYDANGNLVGDGTNTYTWDARNHLAFMTGPGLSASFQYDAFGRRTNKTINGSSTGFLYDGFNPVQELSGTTPTANLLTGRQIDQYFARTDAAGSKSFLNDQLGSTVALADSSGTVQTEYTYEPFGNTTVTGATSSNTLQYTGRENDGTGLAYYRGRYYSAGSQRFISNDPIGFNGGDVNLYAYVSNNPLRWRDPLGWDKNGPNGPGPNGPWPGGPPPPNVILVSDTGSPPPPGILVQILCAAIIGCSPGDDFTSIFGPPALTTIGDINYSDHALQQMENRRIPPSVVDDTIKNGNSAPGNRPGTTTFYDSGNNVTVVTNSETGTVITVRRGPP